MGDRKGGGGGRDKRGAGGAAAVEAGDSYRDFGEDHEAIDAWARDAFAGQDMNWTEADLQTLAMWQAFIGHTESLNQKLWQGFPLTAEEQKVMRALDRALKKGAAPTDLVVYRGVSNWPAVLGSISIGSTLTKKNYSATSLDRKMAEDFLTDINGAVLRIRVPAGSRGAWLGGKVSGAEDISGFRGEREFLLPRGSRFRVRNYGKTAAGTMMIDLDLVKRR